MAARLAHLQFPHQRVLLARTRLAYVHLQNLLSDAKRDRAARVFGYVAVWLPEELLVLYLQEGELVAATTTRDGLTYTALALRDALRRVPTAAEYGEICFHEVDDEQLACMYVAQTSAPIAWPVELRVHDGTSVLAHLLAAMFDGVLEIAIDGALHYVTFRNGLPRRVFSPSVATTGSVVEQVRALWAGGGVLRVRRWGVPEPVPVQASPALIDVYRALMRGLIEQLTSAGVRGAAELVERTRQSLVPTHPWLDRFIGQPDVARDPVTTTELLTKAVARWIADTLWATALPEPITSESLLRELTRERRHALQSAGFFEALPWKVL